MYRCLNAMRVHVGFKALLVRGKAAFAWIPADGGAASELRNPYKGGAALKPQSKAAKYAALLVVEC